PDISFFGLRTLLQQIWNMFRIYVVLIYFPSRAVIGGNTIRGTVLLATGHLWPGIEFRSSMKNKNLRLVFCFGFDFVICFGPFAKLLFFLLLRTQIKTCDRDWFSLLFD